MNQFQFPHFIYHSTILFVFSFVVCNAADNTKRSTFDQVIRLLVLDLFGKKQKFTEKIYLQFCINYAIRNCNKKVRTQMFLLVSFPLYLWRKPQKQVIAQIDKSNRMLRSNTNSNDKSAFNFPSEMVTFYVFSLIFWRKKCLSLSS